MVSHEAVHILELTDNGYKLNVNKLKEILLADHVKDTFVTIVSIAGAYRKGKSFLLSLILRYLDSVYEKKQTTNLLGDVNAELTGFAWRGGSKRHTTGILICPKIYQHTLTNGDKISIILVDTQGTFDDNTTMHDCVTIFALSTLMSSVQIYNIFNNIQEDDLQHLQLFTEFGKLAKNSYNEKPFQKLQFLVRDFLFGMEYGVGSVAGNEFLKDKFEIKSDQPKELKKLRQHLKSYFEDINCFVMPHPGKSVQKKGFKGKLNELDEDFKDALLEFFPLIVGPNTLKPKKINGQCIKAKELIGYFQGYVNIFSSGVTPTALTLYEATVKVNCLKAIEESKVLYMNHMKPLCEKSENHISVNELIGYHERSMRPAKELFDAKTKMGGNNYYYHDLLNNEFDKFFHYFIATNEAKNSKTVTKMIDNLKSESKNITSEYETKLNKLTESLLELQKEHGNELATVTKHFEDELKKRDKASSGCTIF